MPQYASTLGFGITRMGIPRRECRLFGLVPGAGLSRKSRVLRRYYQDMVKVLPKIATHFKRGKIDSFVTDLDFQLDAGAVHYLRNTTFS